MTASTVQPRKKINLDRFIFVERYAPTLIKWDILAYFGAHPEAIVSALDLSQLLDRNYQVVRRNVGDLALQGMLDMMDGSPHPLYRLTRRNPHLRDLVQRIVTETAAPFNASQW